MKHIAIIKQVLDGAEVNSVNSRVLHDDLGVKTEYSKWIKRAIEKYGFVENEDYAVVKNGDGNNAFKDYIVRLDMAKELCMVANTPKGKETRKYFIKVEKQSNKNANLQLEIHMHRIDALTGVAKATKNVLDGHENRLQNLEQNRRLESWQEKALQDAKNKKVYELAGDDKEIAGKLHRKVWSLFKKRFHLPRYNELKAGQYEKGLEYIYGLTMADMVA